MLYNYDHQTSTDGRKAGRFTKRVYSSRESTRQNVYSGEDQGALILYVSLRCSDIYKYRSPYYGIIARKVAAKV